MIQAVVVLGKDMPTKYIDFYEVNELQTKIMEFIDKWTHTEKTPISQHKIIEQMKITGIKDFTTLNAINSLLRKGYIRRAVMISNKSYYVQLRRL
jgi:hypothetical protein